MESTKVLIYNNINVEYKKKHTYIRSVGVLTNSCKVQPY